MAEDEISKAVRKILTRTFKLDPRTIQGSSLLKEDLGLDSVDLMDAILTLERELDVKLIQDETSSPILPKTVDDLTNLIRKKTSTKKV